MTEAAVEKKFVDGLKALGCLVWKFVSPGNAGAPDRLVVLPTGRVYFVELKQETGRTSALQQLQHKRLREHNADVAVLYGAEDVAMFIRYIASSLQGGGE